jgi:hypothetical protein
LSTGPFSHTLIKRAFSLINQRVEALFYLL